MTGHRHRRGAERRRSKKQTLSRPFLIEQSRKCPLCSRSFDDSYFIHHIRSQYDYQKHYLLPLRSSPSLPLTAESRANALRNTRRERLWGRRQRQQRDEADQLERAIARRRWIYQHHLYAKVVSLSSPLTQIGPLILVCSISLPIRTHATALSPPPLSSLPPRILSAA